MVFTETISGDIGDVDSIGWLGGANGIKCRCPKQSLYVYGQGSR